MLQSGSNRKKSQCERERSNSLKRMWEIVLKTGNKRKEESRKEGKKERLSE
jgi:hypothetical protein